MRLFAALLFTPEIIAELRAALDNIKHHAVYGKFTLPENLHLTLAFIGETERAADAEKIIIDSAPARFDLTLSGWGRFKRPGGDIVWAGIAENKPLAEYAIKLIKMLEQEGFEVDKRGFNPHITLARQVLQTEMPNYKIKPISMCSDCVSLMRSDRIEGKLTYTEIKRIETK